MNNKEKDWLSEVWRIKRELSIKAWKMGLEKYLELAEKEAEKIFPVKKGEYVLVKDKKRNDYGKC